MHSLKTFIVSKLAMVMLAAMALNTQALAAGSGVLLPGLSTATPGNTVLCFDSGTEQLGPCAAGTVATPACVLVSNRYIDCGDGTVTDRTTGLMWEKKLVSSDAACLDPTQANRNARCVQNTYTWTSVAGGTAANGTLYTAFLAELNFHGDGTTVAIGNQSLPLQTCFAGHCDWRVPDVYELRSILRAPNPCPAPSPCIDAVFGPTVASSYWSSSSLASNPIFAWFVFFSNGFVDGDSKDVDVRARAVRSGR